VVVPEHLLVHLRRVRDLMDREYAERLDLDALAACAGVSKYHFHRCFAATYGTTPAAYLAERRIERAQDLLRATNQMADAVRRSLANGTMGGIGLATDDCTKTYEELVAKGVEFVQPPATRPYGVEAVMRDNSGNWLVLVEAQEVVPGSLDGWTPEG
jgi:AraC-like DNA-binding protein